MERRPFRRASKQLWALPQVVYTYGLSTLDLEYHYLDLFLSASSDDEVALVVAGFFREARPEEWPVANWAFQAIERWRGDARSSEADKALREKDKDLGYDPVRCLKIVTAAMRSTASFESLRVGLMNRSRREQQAEIQQRENFEDFFRLLGLVHEVRKLHKDIGRLIPNDKLANRTRILRDIVIHGSMPVGLNVSFSDPGFLGNLFKREKIKSWNGPRLQNAEKALGLIVNKKTRPREFAVRLFALITGVNQRETRARFANR